MKQLKKSYLGVALALSTCAVLFQNCAAAPPPDLSQLNKQSGTTVLPSTQPPTSVVVQPPPVAPPPTSPPPAPVTYLSCELNGQIIAHGGTTSAYTSSSVPSGQQCVQQTRTCTNGTLSGSATQATCFVQSPIATASCSLDGRTILHGGSITAYSQTNVSYGDSCSAYAEPRYCTNGSLSGQNPFTTCVVAAAPTPPPTVECTNACGEPIVCGSTRFLRYGEISPCQ